ncbi:hypothetical protein PR202_ga12159 [Eleusine coracana subsp. coracana]|uniref:NFACT RNA-binding domain-containing protein n=1 Tax=Eleusine coracana subsp. coracana TaxID=191504 RepID=A0AAV5CBF1_ELECO|nr:hypothetical protein PR202_ga12159 [Eleusine coracana subsp. coracana]
MTTADVAAEVKCLRRLIGMRLANVYDITPKTYLFKLVNSSGITESGESEKIILFQFGLGSNAHYIILELYAQGNILLTDSEYTVMTLLRSHRDDNKGLAIMSRHRYPVETCPNGQEPSRSASDEVPVTDISEKSLSRKEKKSAAKTKQSGSNSKISNGAQSNKSTLKTILGEALAYGPALAEHIILDAGLIPSTKVGKDPESSVDDNTLKSLMESITKNKMAAKKNLTPSEESSTNQKTFDAALDEFYSKIESQRVNQQQKAKEESAAQRLNKIKLDQENRVHTLRKEVDHCVKMAELIEYNLEDVDAAILAVRVSLANEMSWEALTRMIKEERKADDMDEDEKTAPVEKVEVDISLSAHANARRWYEMKKKQEIKQEKTVTAHEKAFKAAEKKTRLQLAQEKTVAAITHMRKVHWFEKFNWFISSENYLVISGRDAQQNELIVKRYMSKGDLYVHAELHGASSTIIKNHKPDTPIPPLTLNQAGSFTVCHSKAWDSKIVTSAWWVYPHQMRALWQLI